MKSKKELLRFYSSTDSDVICSAQLKRKSGIKHVGMIIQAQSREIYLSMNNRVGQTFGNYQLLRILGQGSFAEVYLGQHRYIDTIAAIKVLHHIEQETHEPFQREARVIAHLQHPHIIRIHEFGIEEGQTPYLVMEYTPNGSLRKVHPKGSPISFEQIVSYSKQIASALDHAHEQRIIHRDIKPENILLNARNEVLLSDFGIAVVQSTLSAHMTQNQAGTPLYMAPEQIRQHPCAASDQYALAVMVYEWLCGEPPFRGLLFEVLSQHLYKEPPALLARVPQLSPSTENVIFTALAKEPQRRFPTVQDFATALEESFISTQISSQVQTYFKPGPSFPSYPSFPPSPIEPQSGIGVSPSSLTQMSQPPTNTPPISELAAADVERTILSTTSENFFRPTFSFHNVFRSRWKLVSLLLSVLLIVSGLASFFLLQSASHSQVQQNGKKVPGGQPQQYINSVQSPQAQQSPQAIYASLSTQSPNLTFYSDGWLNGGRCNFDAANGIYNVSIVPGQTADFVNYYSTYCWNKNAFYHNLLYQADINIARGDCAGLLFRLNQSSLQGSLYNGAQPAGYYMGICPNWSKTQGGTCQFFVYFNAPVGENSQECSGIVNNGGGTDTIAVLAQNDTFSFFVNGKLAFSHKDTKYQAGYISVIVSSTNAPVGKSGTLLNQGKFTNLKIWKLAD